MAFTVDYVAKLHENLSTGKESIFFDGVDDNIHWTVMDHTHVLLLVLLLVYLQTSAFAPLVFP